MNDPQLHIVFRTHPVGHIAWWVIAPAIWLAIYLTFRTVGMPPSGMYIIYVMGLAVLISAIYVSTSYCKINGSGLETGMFPKREMGWADIEKWTRWGENGSLFVQSRNGEIIGTGSWAFYGDRIDQLEQLLLDNCGEPATGENGVLPKLLDFFLGQTMRNA